MFSKDVAAAQAGPADRDPAARPDRRRRVAARARPAVPRARQEEAARQAARRARKAYDRVILDCPPGLTETARPGDARRRPDRRARHPLAAVDRARTTRWSASRRQARRCCRSTSMVDRRRALHAEALARHPDWPVIPMASAIEPMAVQRAPVGAFAPQVRRGAGVRRSLAAIEHRLRRDERRPSSLDPQLVLGAYSVGVFPMADSRDADERLLGRAAPPRDPAARRLPSVALAAQDDRRRPLPRHRRRRVRARRRSSAPKAPTTGPRPGSTPAIERVFTDAPRDGLRAFDRMLGRRRAGRRALRPGARPRVLRRMHGQPRAPTRRRSRSRWLVARLRAGGFTLLDCQFMTAHLASLGAIEIDRARLRRVAGRGARRRRSAPRPRRRRRPPATSARSIAWPARRSAARRRVGPGLREGHRAALGPDVVDRVLDDVERRAFLVQPARERPPPVLVDAAHVDLHERAGQLLLLPRRGLLAGAQPHDDVADPRRLAGLQRHVARLRRCAC